MPQSLSLAPSLSVLLCRGHTVYVSDESSSPSSRGTYSKVAQTILCLCASFAAYDSGELQENVSGSDILSYRRRLSYYFLEILINPFRNLFDDWV